MKGKVIVSSFFTALFSAGKASAVTIFPFVFVQTKTLRRDKVLMNHEQIHITQALELLVLPFYVLYVLEFFIRFLRFRNFRMAYRNISFEREAYRNEANLHYLKGRKIWNFVNFYKQ